jgi:hypothetical protein
MRFINGGVGRDFCFTQSEVVREDDDDVGLLSGEDRRLETAGKKEVQENTAHVGFGNAASAWKSQANVCDPGD